MNENDFTDIADELRRDREEVAPASAEFRAKLHQRLTNQLPSPRATRWTTVATALAAMVVVLMGGWAYFGFVRSDASPVQVTSEPSDPVIENDRRYDGWELGIAFDYSDEAPLLSINVDTEGNIAYLGDRQIGWNFTPSLSTQEIGIMVFADSLSPHPTLNSFPLQGMQGEIDQDESLRAIEPPQKKRVGEIDVFTTLLENENAGQPVIEYRLFAYVGYKMVYIRAISTVENERALKSHVDAIVASMREVDRTGWRYFGGGDVFVSAAIPSGWETQTNAATFEGFNSFDFLPLEGHAMQVRSEPEQVERSAVEFLTTFVDENGLDLLVEPVEISAEPVALAIAKCDGGGCDSADNVKLIGARLLYTSRAFVVQWEVAENDLDALQPLFERVVRSLRSTFVPPLISATPRTSLADAAILEKPFYFIAAELTDGTLIYPWVRSATYDPVPEIMFNRTSVDDGHLLAVEDPRCGRYRVTFQNPVEQLIFTEHASPLTDCADPTNADVTHLLRQTFNNSFQYVISDTYLILLSEDGTTLAFSKFKPASAPPYAKTQANSVIPIILAHYRNGLHHERLFSKSGIDNSFSTGFKHFVGELPVWVFDSAEAAKAAIATANIDEIGGILWQRDRFIAQSTGATGNQIRQMLENWFGDPALVSDDETIPFINQDLIAHRWWWVNGLTADGDPIVPVNLERDEQTHIRFNSDRFKHNLMVEIMDRCETTIGEYVVDTSLMTIVEEAERAELPCGYEDAAPLPSLDVQQNAYVTVDHWLFLLNEQGEWLIFSRTKGEDRSNPYPSVTAVDAGLTALRDYLNLPVVETESTPPMKGLELYSWLQADEWRFALLAGTNRLKTVAEIQSGTSYSLSEIKTELRNLSPDSDIVWHGSDWFSEDPRGEKGWMMMPEGKVLVEVWGVRPDVVLSANDYADYQLHHVQGDETVIEIALQYNTDWQRTLYENGIESDTLLFEDDFLVIPPNYLLPQFNQKTLSRTENEIIIREFGLITAEGAWSLNQQYEGISRMPNMIGVGLQGSADSRFRRVIFRAVFMHAGNTFSTQSEATSHELDMIGFEPNYYVWSGSIRTPVWEIGISPRDWKGRIDVEVEMIGIGNDGSETTLDTLSIEKLQTPLP